jgi:hypothetical protein
VESPFSRAEISFAVAFAETTTPGLNIQVIHPREMESRTDDSGPRPLSHNLMSYIIYAGELGRILDHPAELRFGRRIDISLHSGPQGVPDVATVHVNEPNS